MLCDTYKPNKDILKSPQRWLHLRSAAFAANIRRPIEVGSQCAMDKAKETHKEGTI